MGLHRNTWKPDTCACIIEFSFDDAAPDADAMEATHQLHRMVQKCPAHAGLSDAAAYAAIKHDENPRKNKALGHLLTTHPHLVGSKRRNDKGQDVDELDPDKVTFSFDAQRVLRVKVAGAKAAEKAALAAALTAHLGPGKAAID